MRFRPVSDLAAVRAPSPEEQFQFVRNVQRLLDEGRQSSTYKFALLRALADLSVEQGDDSGAPLVLPVTAIAEKFIAYYWRHVSPLDSVAGEPSPIIRQTRDRPLKILSAIKREQAALGESLERVKRNKKEYSRLVAEVAKEIKEMPLWKLQTLVPTRKLEFLYENRQGRDFIELKPGVACCFRRSYTVIAPLIRAAWIHFVRSVPANQPLLAGSDNKNKRSLETFLFGSARAPLATYRPVLVPLQAGLCFYCQEPLSSHTAVDHFIPWVRYPVDLGHNFVLAHKGCNAAKKHALAAFAHLKRWCVRNIEQRGALERELDRHDIAHDLPTSLRITAWAYEQIEGSKDLVWFEGAVLEPLDPSWRALPGIAA